MIITKNIVSILCLTTITVALISIILMLIFFIRNFFINQHKKVSKEIKHSTFEEDTKYLNYLLDFYCENAMNTQLIPYQKNNDNMNIINEDIFDKIVLDVTKKVIVNLSDSYINLLNFYISDVTDFVSSMVYDRILKFSLKLNTQSIDYLYKKSKSNK